MGSVLRRLLFFFQRNQFDRDLEDELRFHEEMKAQALADADGMNGDEARAAARRRIGNPLRLREQSREPWTFGTVETVAQDVRQALPEIALRNGARDLDPVSSRVAVFPHRRGYSFFFSV